MNLLDKKLQEHEAKAKQEMQDNYDSITGEFGSVDDKGVPYMTYACGIEFDLLENSLSSYSTLLIVNAVEIVRQLIASKAYEKPEGGEVKKRDVVVHWRKWPELICYESQSEDEKSKLQITFRISLHHKELSPETYIIGETNQ